MVAGGERRESYIILRNWIETKEPNVVIKPPHAPVKNSSGGPNAIVP